MKKSKRASAKKGTSRKSLVKKQSAKKVSAKKGAARPKKTRKPSQRKPETLERRKAVSRSGIQSGDLQGLRDIEGADSESVNELVEEGNAFEADVVAGVENADDEEGREVHTHEVLEDDVPEEYQDKD